jgi:hypothetical protein
MTPRLVGGIAVAMLAVGVLTGAAGTIVVRESTTTPADLAAIMTDHMDDSGMGSMMSGAMMGSMMGSGSAMGPGSSFGHGMMPGPAASSMPGGLHDQHHPAASPSAAP